MKNRCLWEDTRAFTAFIKAWSNHSFALKGATELALVKLCLVIAGSAKMTLISISSRRHPRGDGELRSGDASMPFCGTHHVPRTFPPFGGARCQTENGLFGPVTNHKATRTHTPKRREKIFFFF